MKGSTGAADAARFALLGLLLDGPRHGYDLARHFTTGSVLGEVLHLSQSQLYALLSRLERDSLITGERQEAGARPPRRVYALTDRGKKLTLVWLAEPVSHPRDMRIEFPLKLYFARQRGVDTAALLLRRQEDLFSRYLDSAGGPRLAANDDAVFLELLREARRGRLRAALEWIQRCRRDLLPETVSERRDVIAP